MHCLHVKPIHHCAWFSVVISVAYAPRLLCRNIDSDALSVLKSTGREIGFERYEFDKGFGFIKDDRGNEYFALL